MAATPFSLGLIKVPTPGTPVQIIPPVTLPRVVAVRFEVFAGGAGKVYLGHVGMSKATFAGVIAEFWPNTGTGPDDCFTFPLLDRESYNLSDFWIDANTANEGLIVSGYTRPF